MNREWNPRISREEWYARWAKEHHRTSDESTPEQSYLFGLLEAYVSTADAAFQEAYGVYCFLSDLEVETRRESKNAT